MDIISFASTVASVVASLAHGRHTLASGIGVISTTKGPSVALHAADIGRAIGYEVVEIGSGCPAAYSLTGSSFERTYTLPSAVSARLDSGTPSLFVIRDDGQDGSVERIGALVARIVREGGDQASNAILVSTSGDAERITTQIARGLKVDPDDIATLTF